MKLSRNVWFSTITLCILFFTPIAIKTNFEISPFAIVGILISAFFLSMWNTDHYESLKVTICKSFIISIFFVSALIPNNLSTLNIIIIILLVGLIHVFKYKKEINKAENYSLIHSFNKYDKSNYCNSFDYETCLNNSNIFYIYLIFSVAMLYYSISYSEETVIISATLVILITLITITSLVFKFKPLIDFRVVFNMFIALICLYFTKIGFFGFTPDGYSSFSLGFLIGVITLETVPLILFITNKRIFFKLYAKRVNDNKTKNNNSKKLSNKVELEKFFSNPNNKDFELWMDVSSRNFNLIKYNDFLFVEKEDLEEGKKLHVYSYSDSTTNRKKLINFIEISGLKVDEFNDYDKKILDNYEVSDISKYLIENNIKYKDINEDHLEIIEMINF